MANVEIQMTKEAVIVPEMAMHLQLTDEDEAFFRDLAERRKEVFRRLAE